MNKMVENSYHIISIVAIAAMLMFLLFSFRASLGRFIESVRDFGLSIGYYFAELFEIEHSIVPKVTLPSDNLFGSSIPSNNFPIENENIKNLFVLYFDKFFSIDNFVGYINTLLEGSVLFVLLANIVIPVCILLFFMIRKLYFLQNNDYGKDSLFLQLHKKISLSIYRPVSIYVSGFVDFLRRKNIYIYIFICIFMACFNIFTIVLELLAYYFYFVCSFDVAGIGMQLHKLYADMLVIKRLPAIVIIAIVLVILRHIRYKRAYDLLNHNELKNRGLINLLPICSLFVGEMGCDKTTTAVDMALSQDVMFRDKSRSMLLENQLKFPNFDWMLFDKTLQSAINCHKVYNLVTAALWVDSIAKLYIDGIYCSFFNYDVHNKVVFDNGLSLVDFVEVLKNYAKEYFIYTNCSSYVVSNLSVRSECIRNDKGNFPLYNTRFFENPAIANEYDFSHVLNFDSLRLGRKVEEDSQDCFEFGCVVITEIGKERQNSKELSGVKKESDETNQKNDMFNSWLKMCRHSSTVEFTPMIKVFADEQRPESLGADVRDMVMVVHLLPKSKQYNALSCFFVEELICDWIFNHYYKFSVKYRHLRGDNTLFYHLLTSFVARVYSSYIKKVNTFNYKVKKLGLEKGTLDGEIEKHDYYLANKKIYADRFSTDCFSDYFSQQILCSAKGLNDIPTYRHLTADIDELRAQNSYFVRDMERWRNHK